MDAAALKIMAAGLISWIHLQADLPVPTDPPDIRMVSHAELESTVCGHSCSVMGFSPDDGTNVVYIENTLDVENNVCDRGILLHELVHFMQRKADEFDDETPQVRSHFREMEALKVQNAYLSQYGRRIFIGAGFAGTGFAYPYC